MNCAGALGAIVAPIAAGYILTATSSFDDVFYAATGVLVLGIVCYSVLLGPIESAAAAEAEGILI